MPTVEELIFDSVLEQIHAEVTKGMGLVKRSVSVSLAEYTERIKKIKLDPWQIDLSERLDYSFRNPGNRDCIAAPPQFGKSIIVSQCLPGWIFGNDPIHRFRLSCYNVYHAARFSLVIKRILNSPEHKEIFKDKAGWIPERSRAVEWSTYDRMELNDGQASFIALGLQTGFVGTGADTLVIDDPYKSVEEALSEVIRDKTWRFYTDTAAPRLNDRSNVIIMFHRYHQDDMGGRAIATGQFRLLRYAAEADGDFEDDETGLKFPDPMNREEGEYLSARFSEGYYNRQKINQTVWYSQFQGRPSAKTGSFFDVTKLIEVDAIEVPPLIYEVRAWDNAATEGAGAFSAGVRMGIDAQGIMHISDVKREQVNTAGRKALQTKTAIEDGKLVEIHAPQDPGSAGKDVAFEFEQEFGKEGYIARTSVVSGSKEMRAYNFSEAVNTGRMRLVRGPWDLKAFKNELRNFPLGTYKDQVDSGADAVNELKAKFYRGRVIKSISSDNLLPWSRFKFGKQIPEHWEVRAACRIAPDASKPSGCAIVARAAENAFIGEAIFVVYAMRLYTGNPGEIFKFLKRALRQTCAGGIEQATDIYVNKGSDKVIALATEKHDLNLLPFEEEAIAGLAETNWYFQDLKDESPFYKSTEGNGRFHPASHGYILTDDRQLDTPENDEGMLSLRQDWLSWTYNDKGEPQPYGGITLDCVRMLLYNFALNATGLTKQEARDARLPEHLKDEVVRSKLGTEEFVDTYWAQQHAKKQIREAEEKDEIKERRQFERFAGRPVQHRRYRRN